MNGTWDKCATRSYLCVNSLNKEAIDHRIRGDWEHPAIWTIGTECYQQIEVLMQFIFLGVLCTCVQMVHE